MYILTSKTPNTRWAVKDNSMIFGQIVWMSTKEEAKLYHLIGGDGKDVPFSIEECLSLYEL